MSFCLYDVSTSIQCHGMIMRNGDGLSVGVVYKDDLGDYHWAQSAWTGDIMPPASAARTRTAAASARAVMAPDDHRRPGRRQHGGTRHVGH